MIKNIISALALTLVLSAVAGSATVKHSAKAKAQCCKHACCQTCEGPKTCCCGGSCCN